MRDDEAKTPRFDFSWEFAPSAVYQEPYWYPAIKLNGRLKSESEYMPEHTTEATATILYQRQGFDLEAQAVEFAGDWLTRYP